jgi:hypothetical protein
MRRARGVRIASSSCRRDVVRNDHNIGANLVKGALAGAAATWLMGRVTTWLYEQEAEDARRQENEARGNRSAYEIAADKLAGSIGARLDEDQRARLGSALHWTTGVAAGMAYAAARHRSPALTAAKGLFFGSAFFLVVDEFLNTALGLTPPPAAFPWQAHARGLSGHLAYGLTTELVLEGLDRVA